MAQPAADTRVRTDAGRHDDLRAAFAETRARTLALVAEVSEEDLVAVHDPLMSPLAWDLGHIAAYEDLWVCRAAGLEPLRPDLSCVYDAFETPRADRPGAEWLHPERAREYMEEVRERALDVLERSDPEDDDPLLRDSFVWELLVEHEQQHNETMLQALALAPAGVFSPLRSEPAGAIDDSVGGRVRVEGGEFERGAPRDGFSYDNERPRGVIEVAAFELDRAPVTGGEYLEFIADGGYEREQLWSGDGWRWRSTERARGPLFWTADGAEREFEHTAPVDRRRPVQHVCFWEAEAFARWRGGRLPTEPEWEKAAAHDPGSGASRRFPWGDERPEWRHANLDQLAFGPEPAEARPDGASPCGAFAMIGDVWEWTSTEFDGYPGFAPFPYPEYSQVFFRRGYRVLRGGSWATRPRPIRASFRNWDLPQRRQLFVGLRCAYDLEGAA